MPLLFSHFTMLDSKVDSPDEFADSTDSLVNGEPVNAAKLHSHSLSGISTRELLLEISGRRAGTHDEITAKLEPSDPLEKRPFDMSEIHIANKIFSVPKGVPWTGR